MRLQQSDPEFAHWVLQVGEGNAPKKDTNENGDDAGHMVLVEDQLLKPFEGNPLQHIVETTYGDLGSSNSDTNYVTDRAILTPRNETVDELNAYMISRVEGLAKEYFSSDSFGKTDSDSQENDTLYAVEYLNSLEFPGLPSHKICLKLGVPIMLMRNLNQREGLWNGTRLIVIYLGDRVIEGEIMTGTHVGQKVLIPRINLSEANTKHPFTLSRQQFPIRVCYAMTINKSQGQSLKSVLLYLPKPMFTHGQLYVALSRVTTRKGMTIIQVESSDDGAVKNIVYKEIYNGLTA